MRLLRRLVAIDGTNSIVDAPAHAKPAASAYVFTDAGGL